MTRGTSLIYSSPTPSKTNHLYFLLKLWFSMATLAFKGVSYQTFTRFCTNGAPGCTPQMTFTFDLCQTGHLGPNDALLHPESSNGWKAKGSLWDRNFNHFTELEKKNTGGKHVIFWSFVCTLRRRFGTLFFWAWICLLSKLSSWFCFCFWSWFSCQELLEGPLLNEKLRIQT